MRMRWTYLLMSIVLAAIAFGGTFTCEGHKNQSTVRTP
jgi:hypothetical protein